MFKRITIILFMFLSVITLGYSQVQIGTGTNTDQALPYKASFGYSYSQSIYLASEINAAGTITAIKWYYTGNGVLENSQNLDIYIGNTTKTSFSDTNDWDPIANLTLVYTGGITTDASPGWKTITLTVPFTYDGTSNLIIAVDDNQEASDNFSDTFYNSEVSDIRSLAVWGDSEDIDAANPPEAYSWGGFENYVPNIIFEGITQACPTPIYVTTTNVLTTSASVTWQAPPTAPTGGTDYYLSTTEEAPLSSTIPTGNVASGTIINISALTPETNYYVWVRSSCGIDGYSNWSAVSAFKTDCIAIPAFIETFDNDIVPNLPACWNKIIRSSVVLSPYDADIYTNDYITVKSAPNSLSMNGSPYIPQDTDIILASPNLSTLSLGTYRLKFWATGNTTLKIGTLNTNDNAAVFTEIPGTELTLNTVATQYVINFTNYTGSDTYVGISLQKNLNNTFANNFANIDDIVWELQPSCPDATDLIVTSISTDSSTVQWTSGDGNSVSWDAAISTDPDADPNTLAFINASTTSVDFTGLTENTTYYVWVRTVCSSENGYWTYPISFKTACAPIANFYENFNSSITPNLPDCWSKIIAGPSVSQYAWVETTEYSNMFPTPSIAAYLNYTESGDSVDNNIILVSPNLSTLSLGTYRLKFYAKKNNDSNLEIVTLNNNTESATITSVQEITLTETTTQYVVEFDNATTDTYIGFRLKDAGFYGGVYLDNILWELSPTCPDVANINVPSTTTTTADVEWNAGGSEESWDIAVAPSTVEDPSSLTFVNSTTDTVTLTGLVANTNYNVWVRSVCAGNDNGAWIGPISFATACDAVASFIETFQNAETPQLPACWNKIIVGGDINYPGTITTSPYAYMPNETVAVLMQNSDSDQVILVSPNLSTLSLGTYRLKFLGKGDGGILEIGTLSSATPSAVFTQLSTVNTTSQTVEYTIPFDGYSGTDTYIGIRVSNSVQYQYIELDNIIWQPTPLCPDVNDLTVAETTMTSGTIVWDGGTASNWEIAVGSIDDTEPNDLAPYATSNSADYEITALTAGTSYNVWVRSTCGTTLGNGYWTGPIVVTTQCDATTVPYLQDFESASTPNLPACTSAYNLSDGPYNWYTSGYEGYYYGFESTTLVYNGDCCTDANAWFFTQGITLTAGVNYTISYRYGGTTLDDLYLNSLKVMYGTAASELAMTLPIADHEDFLSDSPLLDSVTITPPTTGVYYFGFNAYSDNNSYLMFVDDILIDVALANNTFEKSQLSYYPNPVKDVLNISNNKNITAVSVFNILGQEVITQPINGNVAKINMSTLAKGAYMVKVTSDNLVKTIKVIKE